MAVNGCQQGFRSVASFGFGGQESASKPPQAICKTFFIEHPPKENKLRILEKKLITIYMICFDLKNTQGKDPKIKIDYELTRNNISPNFKELGFYNDVLEIRDNLGNTEFTTGDAIDDLTDIVKDLKESLTLEKEKDILSNMKLDFETHFKNHLINLLRYINSDI
jgi:hypothetical protein